MAHSYKSSSQTKPVVGVLVGEEIIRLLNAQNDQFKTYIRFLLIMQANEEANEIVYIFCASDVNFTQNKVRGTYFNQAKQRWVKRDFPLPDVIYVRGGKGEKSRSVLDRFDKMGVRKVNPILAFDKWDLFRRLQRDEDISPYLPMTQRLRKLEDLESILEDLGDVYIKGCRGSRGKRVMRVTEKGDDGYEYSYNVNHVVRKTVQNIDELRKVVKAFFGDNRILVQQAIDLLRTDDGRLVDFRAEVQRNEYGDIEILGTSIRVGQSNSPITIHSDAYTLEDSLKDFLLDYSSPQLDILESDIRDFLTTLYTSVEKVYGTFGEIGIDFGLDYDGNIWLIECNAQSAKVSLQKAYGTETLRQSYLNPLQFAKLLTRKSTAKTERRKSSQRSVQSSTQTSTPVLYV